MTILETAVLIFLVGCLVCVVLVVGLIHLSEWLRIRRKLKTAARIRRKHPLQYGYRGREIVFDPGDDATVGERYNRCPNCEQWSPCDVRELLDTVLNEQKDR